MSNSEIIAKLDEVKGEIRELRADVQLNSRTIESRFQNLEEIVENLFGILSALCIVRKFKFLYIKNYMIV